MIARFGFPTFSAKRNSANYPPLWPTKALEKPFLMPQGVRYWPGLSLPAQVIAKLKAQFYSAHSTYSPPLSQHIRNRCSYFIKMVCKKSAESPLKNASTARKESSTLSKRVVLRNSLSLHETERSHLVLDQDDMADVPFLRIPNLSNVLDPPQFCESAHYRNVAWLFFYAIPDRLDSRLLLKAQAHIP
jgi:hypothetical protein